MKGTITITGRPPVTNGATKQTEKREQEVIFKSCALFTDCINDNAKDLDVVISMYNLIKYSDSYSKTSACLLHYFREEPDEANNVAVTNYKLLKSKTKIAAKAPAFGTMKDVEIGVLLTVILTLIKQFFKGLLKCF